MAKKDKPDTADEAAKLVNVVVLKGKLVCHDGEEYKQNTRVELPEADAMRLITLGFVKTLAILRQEAEQAAEQNGTEVKADGQTSITMSDPSTQQHENGAG